MKINNLRGSDPNRPYGGGRVDVYAHRGSTILAPENTAEAFELALDYGADVLEIDVRLSRDGQVVVIHDARVDRTCNGQGKVADLNLAQLKRLDAGFYFTDLHGVPSRGQSVRLLTLDELFARFPDTRINIDIKDNSAIAAQAVAACIERGGRRTQVNVGSFHAPVLHHFRLTAPDVSTAATQREVAHLYFARRRIRTLPFEYLQIPVSYYGIPLAGRRFLQLAQSRGINVVYWTINSTSSMQSLIDRGVHGLVTDRVDLACRLLGRSRQSRDFGKQGAGPD
ncbi:MAG: glycerophosphodiester phosphodiesterase [Granulosicoccus sp.]|nr:glycerophosphodiester phosphodiesterase [Granulosicoccus sp.]